jgi:hypothetical protein
MKLSIILLQGLISFGVIRELLAAQTIFDLGEATPAIPFGFTCDDFGKGCAIRGVANVQVESPVAFCDDGFVTWTPVLRELEPLVVASCIGGLCTVQCSEGCTCRRSDGRFCPSSLEHSDVFLEKKPPVLPNTCKAAHPDLDEALKEDYSIYCPNLMSQELNNRCACVFNFCNGVFQGCDDELLTTTTTTTQCGAQNGQRGRERCVAADRLCPDYVEPSMAPSGPSVAPSARPSGDSADAPADGAASDMQFFLSLIVSLAVVVVCV